MDQSKKQQLLTEAQQKLATIGPIIAHQLDVAAENLAQKKIEYHRVANAGRADQQLLVRQQLAEAQQRTGELTHLKSSPYFFRCDVIFEGKESQTLYFARFPFTDQHIYSWVTPAATMRFEDPGPFLYQVPDGKEQRGILTRKDQFMIVDGQIRFMATESQTMGRELVYQEYLSQRKSSFILPEIVEQMERAQDQVVRAHHRGSFLIAGPAGSGKTTLALHRVAYLTQSPDTSALFPGESIIVFVQDVRTKDYFSSLLPQLGIEGVLITTFAEWALECLELDSAIGIGSRFGTDELERDEYEYAKYEALKNIRPLKALRDPFLTLTQAYESYFNGTLWKVWQSQQDKKLLDRFDITILLTVRLAQGPLTRNSTKTTRLKNGRLKHSAIKVPISYALMVVDEAENYLAEQIHILHTCIQDSTRAMLYVGDLAQQTQLCTLRDWTGVGEDFEQHRKVVLEKVYRNTQQILEYIGTLGYAVAVPPGLRTGNKVQEYTAHSIEEELLHVTKIIENNLETVVGIMAKTPEYLIHFHHLTKKYQNVHVLTINEAQGVEFDVACLVGVHTDTFATTAKDNERARVNRDLIYVALTRAMNELHILGSQSLRTIALELKHS